MKAKVVEQTRVRELRSHGFSYREIMQRVNGVSKNSISLWCHGIKLGPEQRRALGDKQLEAAAKGRETIAKMRAAGIRWNTSFNKPSSASRNIDFDEIKRLYWEEEYSIPQIAKKLGKSSMSIYERMKKNSIPRRTGTEANYVAYKNKPQFKIKGNLIPEEEKLRIAGIMLYWAEGAKERATVDFANSDPQMIKIFLRFLREICGIAESRIRIYLYAFSDQNIDELKSYWSKVTGVPESQFIKPYIRKVNPHLKDRRMPYGLIHVRYNDKRLLECIKSWLSEYKMSLLGAGGGVAKRTRL
ncbi:MAG: hypothetical protein KKH11_01160 [Candidatus Omnitrophica bacterium]|nr:hypothetical protein [Candidatus Omnitrophota bacterium]